MPSNVPGQWQAAYWPFVNESRIGLYGCPIGNSIVELTTERGELPLPLNDGDPATELVVPSLQDLHADWSEERAQLRTRRHSKALSVPSKSHIQAWNNMTDLERIVNF